MTAYGELFDGPPRRRKVRGRTVADYRRVEDGAFVEALQPSTEALARARRRFGSDPAGAVSGIVRHFLRRRRPRWAFDFRRKTATVFPSRNFFFGEAVGPDIARRALRYAFYDCNASGEYHRLTRKVDWDRSRLRDYGSAGWLTMAFGYWALFPAAGYAMTRDPRYARVFQRCWRRWFEEFPTKATDEGLRQWAMLNTRDPAGLDGAMNVGRRALVMTDVLYSGLLAQAPEGVAFDLLKYVWFVATLFLRAREARGGGEVFAPGNHNLFERGTVPFCLGVMFPEFDRAEELRGLGRGILRRHVSDPTRGAIRPDGTSWEHSARYAWYAAGMVRQALELARLNNEPLFSRPEERRVQTFMDHFADLTAPDGQMVPYGDCQPPRGGCHLEPARSLYSDSRARRVARALDAATFVHRPAVERPPREVSRPEATRFFPDSGILVARTGWTPRDSMLFVTAEPRPTYSGHSHHDFGAFQLWVAGVPVFYDAATWAYRIDEIVPAERGYYYSAFSHNLLTVEGYRPRAVFREMGNVTRWWGDRCNPPVTTERVATDGPRGELVVSHRAYADMKVTRTCAFDLTNGRLEITDRVEADTAKRRTFRQWYHLAFGATARVRPGPAARVRHGEVQVACRWTCDDGRPDGRVGPSPEVQRAARVFGFGTPRRLYAERRTSATRFELTCTIEW